MIRTLTCSVTGCTAPVHGHDLCNKHLRRLRNHGTTENTRTSPLVRFWPLVDKRPDGCWWWQGNVQPNGYGRLVVAGVQWMAHRYAYELLVGPIPDGLHIDHLCRNRRCVNPSHLEPVTPVENVMRGDTISGNNSRKTHCKRGHPFDTANTYEPPHRPGTRWCRACRRMLDRRRKARLRQESP